MNQAMKKRWVKALRRGNYKQQTGVLQNQLGYCCLGVLADIETDGDWVWNVGEQAWEISGQTDTLNTGLLNKAKISDETQGDLINMNDGGESFDEIADWIEENL